jgi:hypothetical protein
MKYGIKMDYKHIQELYMKFKIASNKNITQAGLNPMTICLQPQHSNL